LSHHEVLSGERQREVSREAERPRLVANSRHVPLLEVKRALLTEQLGLELVASVAFGLIEPVAHEGERQDLLLVPLVGVDTLLAGHAPAANLEGLAVVVEVLEPRAVLGVVLEDPHDLSQCVADGSGLVLEVGRAVQLGTIE
jgi:hypothetical protein